MAEFLRRLFEVGGFMPHGHCYLWQPSVLWLHVLSDSAIAVAYFSIPVALFVFVRRRSDLAFRWVFVLFALFILSCVTNHLLDVYTVWEPQYRVEGLAKAVTAVVSLVTAAALWPMIPRALALPSPAVLRLANQELEAEIRERRRVAGELEKLNRELEARLAERTQELERSNRDLRDFAYAASHDLQEPLRIVTSFVQLLERRYGQVLDADGKRYVSFAVDGARRMNELIVDLLDYSRAGSSEQRAELVSLGQVVDRVRADLRHAIEESGAEISVAELPQVTADPTAVERVLFNLLGNAVKYAPKGERPRVRVEAAEHADRWQLTVRDNGIGIDPRHHERIFLIFQRLHTREQYPGSGVGLATCKRLVERGGGRIWVESRAGAGAAFHFTLPRPPGDVPGSARSGDMA